MSVEEDRDLAVPGGRLRVRLRGDGSGPLAVLVPGLTANLISMERLAVALAGAGWRTAAVDLRGRGCSQTSPPGSYGWSAHARDVLDLADVLGAPRAALVGWSMGAFVAQQAAASRPDRVSHLVLIDAAGVPPAAAMGPVMAAVERLGAVYPSADAYVARVRAIGTLEPWGEIWERYLRYELEEVPGGVRSRTSREAVLEDVRWGETHDPTDLWPALRCPVLLLRATQPFLPTLPEAFVVPTGAVPAFRRGLPRASVVEIEANHYGIGVSPQTASATADFLA